VAVDMIRMALYQGQDRVRSGGTRLGLGAAQRATVLFVRQSRLVGRALRCDDLRLGGTTVKVPTCILPDEKLDAESGKGQSFT
jgi:hypothetical protein